MSSEGPGRRDVTIVLQETRIEHERTRELAGGAARAAPRTQDSPDLVALLRCAGARGATVAERQRRSPINLCRNYYDGGRDLDLLMGLLESFGATDANA